MDHLRTIEEINKLRSRLNRDNESYFGDIVAYLRSSDISQQKGDELLLEMAAHLVQAQDEGRSAIEVFGEEPEAYCKELIREIPKPGWRERISTQALIVLGVTSWMFAAHAVFGFLYMLTGWGIDSYSFNVYLLVLNICVANLFVYAVFLYLRRGIFEERRRSDSFKLGLVFIGVHAAVVVIGYMLRNEFPVITITPWISLLIAAVGFTAQKLLFFHKPK